MGTNLPTHGLVASIVVVITVISYKLLVSRCGPSLALRSPQKRLALLVISLIIVGLLIASGIAEQVKSSHLAVNESPANINEQQDYPIYIQCPGTVRLTWRNEFEMLHPACQTISDRAQDIENSVARQWAVTKAQCKNLAANR